SRRLRPSDRRVARPFGVAVVDAEVEGAQAQGDGSASRRHDSVLMSIRLTTDELREAHSLARRLDRPHGAFYLERDLRDVLCLTVEGDGRRIPVMLVAARESR